MAVATEAYVADACALIAFFADAAPPRATAAMRADAVAVSPITVWELTRKAALGKLPPLPRSEGSFAGYLEAEGFLPLPLTWLDTEAANTLPQHHKDPMDRMLIAQALRRGMTIITDDGVFAAYGVKTLW